MRLLNLEIKKIILFCLILIGGVFFVFSKTQAYTVSQTGFCTFSGDTLTYCYPLDPREYDAGPNERISSSKLDFTISGSLDGGQGDVVLRGGNSTGMENAPIADWNNEQYSGHLEIGIIGVVGDGWTDFFIQGLNTSSVNWTWTVTVDVYGCTNSAATNYNSNANIDDGSCILPTGAVQVQSTFAMTANITGPQNYSVSTGNNYAAQIFWQAPLGTYTISNISNINCYSYSVRPPGTTQTITTNGQSIFFIVDYTDSCPTPSLTFSASPNPVAYNAASTLTWTTSNASSCTASGDWSGSKAAVGGNQSTGNLTVNKTYTLTCYGQDPGDSVTKSVTVNVSLPPAPIVNLKCNGVESCGGVAYGEVNTLSWSITNGAPTTSCTASNAWSGARSISDSESTGPILFDKTWTIQCAGPGGTGPADSVSATVPAPEADVRCDNSNGPCNISWGASSFIEWCGNNAHACANSASCSVTRNGSAWASGTSGAQTTGVQTIPGTYTYTLICSGDGSTQDSVAVIVGNPVPNNPSNITATQPNYCVSGPAATIGWTYSDPSGSPQQSYQVQMDVEGSFQVPEYDSCVNQNTCASGNSSWSNFTGQGILLFNTTYKTRVRVWNSYGQVSGWTVVSGNFNTPPYAYPQVDFFWTANGILNNPSPPLNKPVDFTDLTVFNGNPLGRRWDWLFGDGGTSTLQNPSRTYVAEGSYYVTLTATDNANQSCARTKGPLIIQKPIPKWREIAPR